jgi:hypothetical protein
MEINPFYYESMLKYGLGYYLREHVQDLPENSLEYAVQSGDEDIVIWLLDSFRPDNFRGDLSHQKDQIHTFFPSNNVTCHRRGRGSIPQVLARRGESDPPLNIGKVALCSSKSGDDSKILFL